MVPPLLLAVFDIVLALLVAICVYRWDGPSAYVLSSWGVLTVFPVYGALLLWLVIMDFMQVRKRGAAACNRYFNGEGGHTFALASTMLFLTLLAVLAIIDARKE